MRLAIDARAYRWAGVGRYINHLLEGLVAINPRHDFLVLLAAKDRLLFVKRPQVAWLRQGNVTLKFVESSYYSWREQLFFGQQIRKIKADLWHFPNFNVPLFFRGPYVVTVHDTTRFIFPGQVSQSLTKQIVYEQVFKHTVEQARGVIYVSQSAQDSLRYLPIKTPARQTVIYQGVAPRFYAPVTPPTEKKIFQLLGGQFPYLLYVGVWMNHKNIPRLLLAFSQLAKQDNKLKLVITGQPKSGYVNVNQLIKQYKINPSKVVLVGYAPDSLLPALYAKAKALLFPSLYEGFGLPAVEAAAAGTPVIAANVSSLPEIMRDGAVYVNPENVADITTAISSLLYDHDLRRRIINRGRARARHFNWRKCANLTNQFYHHVLSS